MPSSQPELRAKATKSAKENILFPYIERLILMENNGAVLLNAGATTISAPIQVMVHEHESAGEAFREISKLSNGYHPPDYACNTYRVLYAKLQEFEQDLHLHVHLENNILFNAGRGSVFTKKGVQEMDAAIMDGASMCAGSVTGVRNVMNPIELAYEVMANSIHVFLSGKGANDFAIMFNAMLRFSPT